MELIRLSILLIITLSIVSCSGTKGLRDSDKLFVGTTVKFVDKENISDKNTLIKEIKLSYLKENSPGIFNLKTGFYNFYDSVGTNKFKNGIKYKMGSAPVIFENSMLKKTELRLESLLIGSGYLQSNTECDTFSKARKVRIKCEITLNKRYKIDSIFYPKDTLPLARVLRPMYTLDFLKSGEYIQRKNMIQDRDAFIETAHNNGYPFINDDDVVFVIDTTVGNNLVDVHMQIRPTTDSTKYERYRYGSIYINPNFLLDEDLPMDTSGMIQKEDYHFLKGYNFMRENSLKQAMYIKEGIIYNQSRSNITSNRLLDYGLFKFVNIKTKLNSDNTIDHFYNLTTNKMQSITGELELTYRPGNFVGFAAKTSYINKNLFKGAERFEVSLAGGLETQFTVDSAAQRINTNDITLETSLSIPSIVLPFFPFRTNRNFVPRTFMSLSLNRQINTLYYSARSIKAKYGFKWHETENKTSFWIPIDFQWYDVYKKTSNLDSLILEDPSRALSFQSNFALGSSYEYVYNKRSKFNPVNQFYFKGIIESSGTLLNLLVKSKPGNQQDSIFGIPFAQYLRLTADVRKYWSLNIGSIASRFVVGTGLAFGNSNEIPFSKQYSVGGANDIRAFGLRRIGPGSYIPTNTFGNQNNFIDQTGDIKIEANVEYRFPIIGYFKGAFFVDAGNIWLFESSEKPEGVFEFDKFYTQIAVGTGFGLRFDLDYFLIRLDLAFPIRDIDDNGNFGWRMDDINFLSATWRSENLVWNLGIGYPF